MVAITPRFAALFTFVTLASFSFAPMIDAVVIPRSYPSAPLSATGRNHNDPRSLDFQSSTYRKSALQRRLLLTVDILGTSGLLALQLGRRQGEQPSPRFPTGHKQAAFSVYKRHAESISEQSTPGEVRIIDSENKAMGKLAVASKDKTCTVYASKDTSTPMTLVHRTPDRAKSGSMMLQVPDCNDPSVTKCLTYHPTVPGKEFTLEQCGADGTGTGCQSFLYNDSTGCLQPYECANTPVDQPQNVLQREESVTQHVQLVFVPALVPSEYVNPLNASAVAPTSTMTVTVTESATSSLSAAGVDATPTDISGSSSAPDLTSTAALSTSTASVAPAASVGALDVQVVEPSSSSNITATATSEPATAPSTTMNVESIASSIAASTDAALASSATANATSSAAGMEASMTSSVPFASPTPVEAYSWVSSSRE